MKILVTGGARGLGGAMAERFKAAGHRVHAPASRDMDVTDPDSISRYFAGLDGLDMVICNSGVFLDTQSGTLGDLTPAQWSRSFAVNVTGVALTVAAALPMLRASQNPKIAIISSQMGSSEHAPGALYAYRASKAAATNLGRNLATDLAPEGIAVGIYHPGWVQTDMGGAQADLTIAQSIDGLMARFESLDMATTGSFLTWDGREHPF